MSVRFIHTADWQIGKPFASVPDPAKQVMARQERLAVIERIGGAAREHRAEFILVAGDLFDSPLATKADVVAVCAAVGAIGLPVHAIPGNHDHGGPGGLWEQGFFREQSAALAPNLTVHLIPVPVELPGTVLFPCPLLRRHETGDTTAWLRMTDADLARFGEKPRVVLAHGSVQGFGAEPDEEDLHTGEENRIDLERLPAGAYDYIALGDWHGTRQMAANAWYSGTPERDRFPKGDSQAAGQVLAVTAGRGVPPVVQPVTTGRFRWHGQAFTFAGDASLDILRRSVEEMLGGRAQADFLLLELEGSLGIEAAAALEKQLETWDAMLLRLKLRDRSTIAPAEAELDALVHAAGDPLIASVAAKLAAELDAPDGDIARLALRELHAACLRA